MRRETSAKYRGLRKRGGERDRRPQWSQMHRFCGDRLCLATQSHFAMAFWVPLHAHGRLKVSVSGRLRATGELRLRRLHDSRTRRQASTSIDKES